MLRQRRTFKLEIKMKNWSSCKGREKAWKLYFCETKPHILGPLTLKEIQDVDAPTSFHYSKLDNTPETPWPDVLDESMGRFDVMDNDAVEEDDAGQGLVEYDI